METTNKRSKQLLRRMVLHEQKTRVPNTAKEEDDNKKAVKMIVLAGCLNYAMVDLEAELTDAGKFKHEVKKNFNLANKLVMHCHSVFCKMLASKDFPTALMQYLQHTDKTWDSICSSIYLESLEGAYNKVLALCRLTLKYNEMLRGRYDCYIVDKLSSLPKFLDGLCLEDYNLDFVVEQQISYK